MKNLVNFIFAAAMLLVSWLPVSVVLATETDTGSCTPVYQYHTGVYSVAAGSDGWKISFSGLNLDAPTEEMAARLKELEGSEVSLWFHAEQKVVVAVLEEKTSRRRRFAAVGQFVGTPDGGKYLALMFAPPLREGVIRLNLGSLECYPLDVILVDEFGDQGNQETVNLRGDPSYWVSLKCDWADQKLRLVTRNGDTRSSARIVVKKITSPFIPE
ncbi:MAG: hypothetical protein IT291_10275 [Deltaproteobacteria bacterium]|nr:hypothetical protein [Deltaproteobacteria bacterium]